MKLLFRIAITLMITALLFGSMPVQSTKATSNALLNNWSALGPIPVNGQVNAIAISGTGDVYVDSDFINGLGWSRSDTIAKWDSTSWSFLGTTPLNGSVTSIAISDADEVYVGGLFSNAGGNSNADHIAKWNGTSWSALGTIPLTDNVYAIAVNGNVVYAGGTFQNAGGDPNADYIAKWDGTAWSALGTPLSVGVSTIAVNKTTGDIYAGGNFTNAGGDPNADYIAKWNGTSWSALGTMPLNSSVSVIAISETGDVYAGGNFTNAGGNATADYIAKWNGTNWSSLGITPSTPKLYDLYGRAIAIRGNEVYVGFASGGGSESAMFVAKWDGTTWSDPAASKLTYSVYSLAINDTFLYVGGSFKDAGGNSNADYITMVELPALPSLYVTNTNDNGPGSLRKAISDATNGDTITFDPSLAGETIRLQSTLTIDKSIAIDASALSEKIILSGDSDNDGDGDILILNILANHVVTIKNIEFTKGYTSNTLNAGAIANLGNLSIYDSEFTFNQGGQGGAIRNSGQLLIENSSFTSNTATEGGGVFNELNKTLTITGSTFSNNSAIALPGPIGGAAGAIANIGAVNIENSTFLNNQSHTGGGAIVNSLSGNATISNSTFTDNTTFGNGGAINNFEGTMTIGNSTFTDNAAINYSGGAISNSAQITINESSFSRNQANFGSGGAVVNSQIGTMLINGSSISENTSSYGAGIMNLGSAEITNTEISANSATQGGGGILNGLDGTGTLSFSNGTISGNSAPYGGGVFNLANNGSVTLESCSITGNTSTDSGSGHGGGASNFVQMTINNCTIANNSAPHYGGGIFSAGTLTVNNSTISNNSALNSGGIEFYGTLSLKNTIIANSTSGKDCFSSSGTMTQNVNNLIEDNAVSPNQCGTPSSTSDPILGVLANNGGPTQTMALLNGSPAINAGHDASCINTDQRGTARPQGIHCDIGAFEYVDNTAPVITSITRASNTPTSATSVDFTVTFSEDVTGVNEDGSDFELNFSSITGASITGVTPVSASVYTVSVNTGSGNGTIRLDVPNTATIKDLANNNLSGLPFTAGETYTVSKPTTIDATIDVTIGGVSRGTYGVAPGSSQRVNYAGLDAGPVVVDATNDVPIIAALRDAYFVNGQVESFVQLMGLPEAQLSTKYYFPAYNNVTLDGQLRFGNVGNSNTTVTVTIAGVVRGTYDLTPGQAKRVNYTGLDAGPVIVESSGGVPIIAALRDAYFVNGQIESFAQLMGLPASQLSDTYYFPAYNNVSLNGQLRVGNVDSVSTTVTVTIAGVLRGTYPLAPNEAVRINYAGLDAGPVVVQSSGGVKIIAALRDAYFVNGQVTSFVQLMGLPASQLSTKYYFPAYNNVSLDGQLRFGNVGNSNTTVTVTIGGVVRGTYNLAPGQAQRVNYAGLDAGPVVVESSGGVPIIAALRDAYFVNGVLESFAQLMGLPDSALSPTYYFPAYNNVSLNGQLRFGVP